MKEDSKGKVQLKAIVQKKKHDDSFNSKGCQHFIEINDVTPSAKGCEDCLKIGD
ncbi:MAG: hypothetical protein GWN62_14405, partial [Aliifodinibius sp.]|nr:hypothetical protein [Fodinibius sp.]